MQHLPQQWPTASTVGPNYKHSRPQPPSTVTYSKHSIGPNCNLLKTDHAPSSPTPTACIDASPTTKHTPPGTPPSLTPTASRPCPTFLYIYYKWSMPHLLPCLLQADHTLPSIRPTTNGAFPTFLDTYCKQTMPHLPPLPCPAFIHTYYKWSMPNFPPHRLQVDHVKPPISKQIIPQLPPHRAKMAWSESPQMGIYLVNSWFIITKTQNLKINRLLHICFALSCMITWF